MKLDAPELVVGPSLGLIAHFLLQRNEPSSLFEFALIPTAIGLLEPTLFSFSPSQTVLSLSLFLFALALSALYYRILSLRHPLHHIPGPVIVRSTQLWLFQRLYNGRPRVDQRDLHERFGPVVRIGPNEVSIADTAALNTIYGAKHPWFKGKSYSFTASGGASTAEIALSAIRDHKEHTFRRRIWDRAFSISSLKNYQPSIQLRIQQLCTQLDSVSTNGPLDLQEWIACLVFDVMTDLAWGGGGDAIIRGGDPDGAIASLRYSLHLAGMTKVLPWFGAYLTRLPWIKKKTRKFHEFSREMFLKRQARGNSESRDVFYYLLGEGSEEGRQLSIDALQADSRQAVTGGAETTVSSITYLFYCLLCSPMHYKLLQETIDSLHDQNPEDEHLNFEILAKCPLLEACINEALRLQPPIPFQNQRIVPPTGATIQSIYLPPGTHVRTATYAIARSSSNFDAPDEFKPERWLPSDSSLAPEGKAAFNPKASVPFLLGPYNCVGRNFALMEMRATVATLVRRYDMRLVERFDKERFDRMIEDRSILEIEGALDVIVTRRAKVQDKS